MPDLNKLRKHFDQVLKDVWEEWDSHTLDSELSPFENMETAPGLEENAGFNYSVGWAEGVSNAMDWPLDRPLGPKEWSPKGKHPPRVW